MCGEASLGNYLPRVVFTGAGTEGRLPHEKMVSLDEDEYKISEEPAVSWTSA
jgi:hypothetical protein